MKSVCLQVDKISATAVALARPTVFQKVVVGRLPHQCNRCFASRAVHATSPGKTVAILNNRDVDITLAPGTFSRTSDFAESPTTCGNT